MLWLSAGCVRLTRSAALVNVRASTMARKCSSCSRSMGAAPDDRSYVRVMRHAGDFFDSCTVYLLHATSIRRSWGQSEIRIGIRPLNAATTDASVSIDPVEGGLQ